MTPLSVYPNSPAERNAWILAQRGSKNKVSAESASAAIFESEIGPDFTLWPTATLFLTNRECPFRCLMCDLWQNTLDSRVEIGQIPCQIKQALENMPAARAIKLYNAGSYFDPGAIPPEDDEAIAALVRGFERVIVESHTTFLKKHAERVLRFQRLISPATLEIAIGLETAHEGVLARLNKRMTLTDFREAAEFLKENRIGLRTFILVRPPFLTDDEGLEWAKRSLDAALIAGTEFAALIPVRAGNGAMEKLRNSGEWNPPSLRAVEAAQVYGQSLAPGIMRVTADLWDIALFRAEPEDDARIARIAARNGTPGANAV